MTFELDSYSNRYGSEMSICNAGASYEGIIGIQVYSNGGILKRELNFNTSEYKFKNLVTDAGLNALGNSAASSLARYCRFGTGSIPPSVEQTSLISPIGVIKDYQRNISSGNSGIAPWYNYRRREWIFNPGDVSGNLTEIGFFNSGNFSSAVMFSRALIKDELGNPTTLTILPDEYVYVTYELRAYVGDLTDVQAEIELGGITYNLNIRKYKINEDYQSIWGPDNSPYANNSPYVYASPEQAGLTGNVPYTTRVSMGGSGTLQTYVSNSLKRSFVTTSSPSQANIPGGFNQILATGFSDYAGFSIFFDKMVPKDTEKTMSFTITTSWSRYVEP